MGQFSEQERENIVSLFKKAIETNEQKMFFDTMRIIIAGYIANKY